MSLGQISEETGIARSTISSWFRDSKPTPRTLSKLEFVLKQIQRESERKIKREIDNQRIENWDANGGLDRVKEFTKWVRGIGDGLRNDHPDFNVNFPHWEKERKHVWEGHQLGLCSNRIF